jgi:DNA-binding response OmpR family regulator
MMRSKQVLTILFVDDEPWFHESLRYALEAKGFECLTAIDMSSAIRIMGSREIALVVTDIMMPAGSDFPHIDSQETGFYLIKELKLRWPETPIVCLSVIGDQLKIRGLRQRRIRYLRKGEVPLASAVLTIQEAATGKLSF